MKLHVPPNFRAYLDIKEGKRKFNRIEGLLLMATIESCSDGEARDTLCVLVDQLLHTSPSPYFLLMVSRDLYSVVDPRIHYFVSGIAHTSSEIVMWAWTLGVEWNEGKAAGEDTLQAGPWFYKWLDKGFPSLEQNHEVWTQILSEAGPDDLVMKDGNLHIKEELRLMTELHELMPHGPSK